MAFGTMASGVFQCSVCTQRYDHGGRLPKVLRCGHTFCLRCVNRCGQQCPVCRRKWNPASPFSVETNFQIFKWLDEEGGDTSESSEWSDDDDTQDSYDDTKEHTIFVQWIPCHFTYREVKDAYSGFGRVRWVRVAGRHEDDGRKRCWAHVTFATAAATSRAIKEKHVDADDGTRLSCKASRWVDRTALGASRRSRDTTSARRRRRARSADCLDDDDVCRSQSGHTAARWRGAAKVTGTQSRLKASRSADCLDTASTSRRQSVVPRRRRAARGGRRNDVPPPPSPPPFFKQWKPGSTSPTASLSDVPSPSRQHARLTVSSATPQNTETAVKVAVLPSSTARRTPAASSLTTEILQETATRMTTRMPGTSMVETSTSEIAATDMSTANTSEGTTTTTAAGSTQQQARDGTPPHSQVGAYDSVTVIHRKCCCVIT